MKKKFSQISDFIADRTPRRSPGDERWTKAAAGFAARGIESPQGVLKTYDALSEEEKFVAICFLGDHPSEKFVSLLFRELRSPRSSLSGIASGTLGMIGGEKVFRRVLKVLRTTENPDERRLAGCALRFFRGVSDLELIGRALIETLQDRRFDEEIRSAAAEGLYHALDDVDRRTRLFRAAVDALIAALDEPSVVIRADAIFALGCLRAKRAVPRLRRAGREDRAKYYNLAMNCSLARTALRRIAGENI